MFSGIVAEQCTNNLDIFVKCTIDHGSWAGGCTTREWYKRLYKGYIIICEGLIEFNVSFDCVCMERLL